MKGLVQTMVAIAVAASDLPVAIYLNQRLIFDLLASYEDGLMQVSTVTTQSSTESAGNRSGELSGGASFLKFFNVGMKGGVSSATKESDGVHEAGQKVHTTASLFARLRVLLREGDQITTVDEPADLTSVVPGSFVEFQAVLSKNALVEGLELICRLMDMVSALSKPSKAVPVTKGQNRQQTPKTNSDMAEIREQIAVVIRDLTASGTVDLVARIAANPNLRAVLSTEVSGFVGSSMEDIIDGEFRVVGKVTRVLAEGADEQIDLLRKSSLGRMFQGEVMSQLAGALSQVNQSGFSLPEIQTQIPDPAIQVIPIAIYA